VLVDYDVNLGPLGIIFGSYGTRVAIDGVAPDIVPSHVEQAWQTKFGSLDVPVSTML
jgi:hypothetical protein